MPRAPVGAVEARRDGPVLDGVAGNVGIEQVERHPPDLDLPDTRVQHAAGQLDRDLDLVAPVVFQGFDGHAGEVVLGIFRHLPAVLIDPLPEVTAAVEQADGHERDMQVAGGFQVVAR